MLQNTGPILKLNTPPGLRSLKAVVEAQGR